MYKGIVKVTYDRGYALQTKSLLLENTTTAADAVVQLFDALGLRGSPSDYALEERNIMTGGKACCPCRQRDIIMDTGGSLCAVN